MSKGPKAKRYAEASFQIAITEGNLNEWASQLTDLSFLMENESVYSFVSSAKVPLQKKLTILSSAMAAFNPLVVNLVCLLSIRNSMNLINPISVEFNKLVDESSGVVRADIYTAVDIDKNQELNIQQVISKGLSREIQVSYHMDPELIGGIVVRVDDLVIDGSIRQKLIGLKRQISK